jgi:hypothetical protein
VQDMQKRVPPLGMSGSARFNIFPNVQPCPASVWQSQFLTTFLRSNLRLDSVNMKAPRLSTLARAALLLAEFTSDAGDSPEDSPWPGSSQAILAGIEEERECV